MWPQIYLSSNKMLSYLRLIEVESRALVVWCGVWCDVDYDVDVVLRFGVVWCGVVSVN